MPDPVVLRTFPASDASLERVARGGIGDTEGRGIDEIAAAVRAALLSAGYPAADVRPRETIADLTPGSQRLLYVYRDGRVRRTNASRERWYESVARARSTLDEVRETWRQSMALADQPHSSRRRRPRGPACPATVEGRQEPGPQSDEDRPHAEA